MDTQDFRAAILALAGRPDDFQRCCIDALRTRVDASTTVNAYDLEVGLTDGGFDAELRGRFRSLAGQIRVSVKGNRSWETLRQAALDDARRHPEHPLLLITGLSLEPAQVETLIRGAHRVGVPRCEVVHSADLSSWLRAAPAVAATWFEGPPHPLRPAGAWALGTSQPLDSAGAHCWLPSEETTLDRLRERVSTRARLVLLAPETFTRAALCLHRFALDQSHAKLGALPYRLDTRWAHPWPAPTSVGRLGSGPVVVLAPAGPAIQRALEWILQVPDAEHRIQVVAVASGGTEAELASIAHRCGVPIETIERVELLRPSASEARTWLGDAFPDLPSLQRDRLLGDCGLAPELLESVQQAPQHLPQRVIDDFPESAGLAVLGRIAALGTWGEQADEMAWMESSTGLTRERIHRAIHAGVAKGWLLASRSRAWGGTAPLGPPSTAARWAILSGWQRAHSADHESLLGWVSEASGPVRERVLQGLVELDQHDLIEGVVFRELRGADWTQATARLVRLAALSRQTHSLALQLALEALEGDGIRPVDAACLGQLQRLVGSLPPDQDIELALEALLHIYSAGPVATAAEGPVDLAARITSPHRLRTDDALCALDWGQRQLGGGPGGLALAEAIVSPWLAISVAVVETSAYSISLGAAGWNHDNPKLDECWQRAADSALEMLSHCEPDVAAAGWRLLSGVGQRRGGGPIPNPDPPGQWRTIMSRLLTEAAGRLPTGPWPARAAAEQALLNAVEHPWFGADPVRRMVEVISQDALFLAWRLTQETPGPICDPEAYLVAFDEGGHSGALSWRHGQLRPGSSAVEEALAGRLGALGLDARAILDWLVAVAEGWAGSPRGWHCQALLRHWVALQPDPFRELLLSDRWWPALPSSIRPALLAVAAPMMGADLLGVVTGASDHLHEGAASRMRQLLSQPDLVPVDEAVDLVSALEELPVQAIDLLDRLAAHPEPKMRSRLALWLYRYLRGEAPDLTRLPELVPRLCRPPGGMAAIDILATGLHRRSGPLEDALRPLLAQSATEHLMVRPNPADQEVLRRGTFIGSLLRSVIRKEPRLLWTVVDWLLADGSWDLVQRLAFLGLGPDPVKPGTLLLVLGDVPFDWSTLNSQQGAAVDHLVAMLPSEALEGLVRSELEIGARAAARSLLVAGGPRPALALVHGQFGATIRDSRERKRWAQRVGLDGGLIGIRMSPPTSRDPLEERESEAAVDPRRAAFMEQAAEMSGAQAVVLRWIAEAMP